MDKRGDDLVGGRYRLEQIVGQGGNGVVWQARDMELDRNVAVKLLPTESEEHKARVWREARLAALLGTSGAVPIYDFGDDGTQCFLVMELVQEPTLLQIMAEHGPMNLPELLSIAEPLLSAVLNAHAVSIVHRDIKPANVFVAGTVPEIESVRLVDFGLAFLNESSQASLGRLTEDNSLSGTPAYLSPEQAQRQEIDTSSDIYSVGCVLYEMSCGTSPFTGGIAEMLSKHIYVPPIPLAQRDITMSDQWSGLIEIMLDKEPGKRPDAKTVLEALGTIRKQLESRHSKRSNQELPRDERMGESTGATIEVQISDRTLSVGFLSQPPDWLVQELRRGGFLTVDNPEDAHVLFAGGEADLPEVCSDAKPIVCWVPAHEKPDVVSLIKRGVATVIFQGTSTQALAKVLNRLVKDFTTR